jgi:acetyl-CoA synthetase
VANWLRAQGVKRGDRVLLMLGNELALWELMLACIKLGAVMIPATMLLTPDDLRDRLERGGVRHVIVASEQAAKFADLPGRYTASPSAPPCTAGWLRFEDSASAPTAFTPDGPTQADDPLLLYFTSGTTASPSWCCTRTRATRSATSHHVLDRACSRATCTSTSARRAGPSTRGAASSRPGTRAPRLHLQLRALQRAGAAGPCWNGKVTSLCAPPTVWRMLIQEDLALGRAWRCAK